MFCSCCAWCLPRVCPEQKDSLRYTQLVDATTIYRVIPAGMKLFVKADPVIIYCYT